MPERTKTSIDAEIRQPGLERIDKEGLIAISSSKFIGTVEVDGETRCYQIEVIAKKADFDLDALLTERKAVEESKAETKAKADLKRLHDEKKRAIAKEIADAKKAETSSGQMIGGDMVRQMIAKATAEKTAE